MAEALLRGARLAVARARASDRRRAPRRARERRARLMRGRLDGAPARGPASTGAGGPVRAAGRRSARGRRATRPGWPTGARVPERRGAARRVTKRVAVRAPHLYRSLRGFCLGAFARSLESRRSDAPVRLRAARVARTAGAVRVPPARARVRRGAARPARAPRGRAARDRGPRAASPPRAIFARAHAGGSADRGRGALPHGRSCRSSSRPPRRCGGFDWDDARLRRARTRSSSARSSASGHAYAAVAPLVGISVGTAVELGDGVRVRTAATGELAAHWPEAHGLLPAGLRPRARPPLRARARARPRSRASRSRPTRPARSPTPSPRSGSRRRAPIAAGPVLFERLDWRPYGIRPVLPIAATQPDGRADPARRVPRPARRATCASGCRSPTTTPSSARRSTAGSSRSSSRDPFRCRAAARVADRAPRRHATARWAAAVRAAVLLGETPPERGSSCSRGSRSDARSPDVVRRALVEVVMHGDRASCWPRSTSRCSGCAPPPAGYFALRAAS